MSKRVWYADILRIIAIVMVVVIHVASKDFQRVPIDSGHWQLLNALNGLSRVSVPILFMVSGMFFLDPQKEVTINKLYQKNIWRLVRIFLFWSVVYVLFDRLIDAQPLLEGEVEKTILEIVQGYFHLWFLYRLVEVYILVPILRMISKEKTIMIYFLVISFILGFLIPTIKQFPIRSTDTIIDNGINLDITIGYAGYMMLGYALHRYSIPDKWKRKIYFAGIVGLVVTVGGTSWMSIRQDQHFDLFYEYLTPNVLVSSAALFLYIKDKYMNKTFNLRQETVMSAFSKYSFGVYLTHVLIRNVIWNGGLNTTTFTPILSIPFLTILILFTSVCVTGVFLQIPLLKKTVT